MSKTVDFYFDYASPASYLASTQLADLVDKTKATVDYHPMLLGAVFKATGNRAPAEVPAKATYLLRDLARYVERYRVAFRFSPHFPPNSLALLRATMAVKLHHPDKLAPFVHDVFHAVWVEGQDPADATVGTALVRGVGLDPDEIGKLVSDAAIKDKLRAEGDAAVARGVFGAPTFFVGSEMYFGQDRLDFVREALLLP